MSASVCTILDMPDEILVQIISYFNARKRLPLAQTCLRLDSLIFEDKGLLSNLDFSKNGRLTTATDIMRYFGKENVCELVRKVNVQNVNCLKPGDVLNNSIGKATNLVDINIHGLSFEDEEQVGRFLEPLVHLKRLSIDWPDWKTNDFPLVTCHRVLKEPLGKLTYLSVDVYHCSKKFLTALLICQELEELRVNAVTRYDQDNQRRDCVSEYDKLPNLRKFHFHGLNENGYSIESIFAILADPREWTQFQLMDQTDSFYIAKNIQVCEELRETKLMKSLPYNYNPRRLAFQWNFTSELLLTEVLKITHKDAPRRFCCFRGEYPYKGRTPGCLLKVHEAQQLLKDPSYQISFLHFMHSIEKNCDAHLIASAFPNLTGIFLTNVLSSRHRVPGRKQVRRCITRRGEDKPKGRDNSTNQASSIQMLVENTPNVRYLTICSEGLDEDFDESWDFEVFDLIPRWQNLTALRLLNIAVIDDGQFLTEIGKQCSKLETLYLVKLYDCFDYGSSCYMHSLAEMLYHCKELREFCIKDTYVDDMPELLMALTDKQKLKMIHIFSIDQDCDSVDLLASFEQMIHSCPKLTTLVLIMEGLRGYYYDELEPSFLRLVRELDRPKFQFQGPRPNTPATVHIDARLCDFPSTMD